MKKHLNIFRDVFTKKDKGIMELPYVALQSLILCEQITPTKYKELIEKVNPAKISLLEMGCSDYFSIFGEDISDMKRFELYVKKTGKNLIKMTIGDYFEHIKRFIDDTVQIKEMLNSIKYPPLSPEQIQAGAGSVNFGIFKMLNDLALMYHVHPDKVGDISMIWLVKAFQVSAHEAMVTYNIHKINELKTK